MDESCHHTSVNLSLKKGRMSQNNIVFGINYQKKNSFFGDGCGVIYFCNDLAKQTIYNGYLFHLKMFSVFVKMKFVFFR